MEVRDNKGTAVQIANVDVDVELSDSERREDVTEGVRASVDFGRSDQTGPSRSPDRVVSAKSRHSILKNSSEKL